MGVSPRKNQLTPLLTSDRGSTLMHTWGLLSQVSLHPKLPLLRPFSPEQMRKRRLREVE